MVIEALLNYNFHKENMFKLFTISFFYSLLGGIVGALIFDSYAGLVGIFFTVLALSPFMRQMLNEEEKFTEHLRYNLIIKEDLHILKGILSIFFGVVAGYMLLYVLISYSGNEAFNVLDVFSAQLSSWSGVGVIDPNLTNFANIIANNTIIILVCATIAYFYGSGALFVITWNASVFSAYIGRFFIDLVNEGSLLGAFIIPLSRYLFHGIFEFSAFILGGIAGSLLSYAVVAHGLRDKRTLRTFRNFGALIVVAFILVIIGSGVETFVIPYLF